MSGLAAQQPGIDPSMVASTQTIVADIRRARQRSSLRFRLIFIGTWFVLVGGLSVALASTGRIHVDFLAEWAPFFLGGVPLTLIGALGRISTIAPIFATATLYVSLVRGTPLIVQIFFVYSALPQFGIVL